MISKRITLITENRRLFFVCAATFILLLFQSRSSYAQETSSDYTLFSPESHKQLMDMLFKNVVYPGEAKNHDITGRFFVIIKMKKGGIIDKVSVNDTDKSINIPLLGNEVVVVGYGLRNPSEDKITKAEISDRSILTYEGIRVAKMLGSVKIPEWEEKDMEFAISFNFTLKYPEEKTKTITIRDNSFKVNPDVIFMLDGKEITKAELDEVDINSIATISVLKGESATTVFGEKGTNGVIVITTKK